MTTSEILKTAAALKATVSSLSTEEKNNALAAMADAIEANKDEILSENALDLADAEGKISPVMLDRLRLTDARVHDMANGVRALIALPDPVGKTLRESTREDGLLIRRISVPLGVVAIIYESRPNVTADAAALCFKSGNVCVLRGGKEAYRSSHAIVRAMQGGLTRLGLDPNCVQILTDVTHDGANELMRAVGLVDLLIPRGGARLIRACVENALVPCIETGTGICHIYVDNDADPEMALNIIENAKTSRPSVCNAAEVCLVGAKIAPQFLPMLQKRLVAERTAKGLQPVELRLDQTAATIIPGTPAGNADFDTEFLDYVLAVAVVEDTNAAIAHIAAHSTHHSEAIITKNTEAADRFTRMVDSAAVYVNASTRFTDGGEFGLGCEMGISTQKLHARGPMGLEELTAYHYVIEGKGHIR
ncbi:MAG: glutamate-5-semialdehyde dehydrogenase [Oscillospiraceae bacterium]|nr:glutamate-5-semialdehyde dehydrogenase [Oscillospiraceae bacterium]